MLYLLKYGEIAVSLNLQNLAQLNVRTAILGYSRDHLEFITRCARGFEDIVLFQF